MSKKNALCSCSLGRRIFNLKSFLNQKFTVLYWFEDQMWYICYFSYWSQYYSQNNFRKYQAITSPLIDWYLIFMVIGKLLIKVWNHVTAWNSYYPLLQCASKKKKPFKACWLDDYYAWKIRICNDHCTVLCALSTFAYLCIKGD